KRKASQPTIDAEQKRQPPRLGPVVIEVAVAVEAVLVQVLAGELAEVVLIEFEQPAQERLIDQLRGGDRQPHPLVPSVVGARCYWNVTVPLAIVLLLIE